MPSKDKAKRAAASRRYYQANRARVAGYHRAWYIKNREKILEQTTVYRNAHKDEIREILERRVRVGGTYICMVGMTRKQREKFQKELDNGTTE